MNYWLKTSICFLILLFGQIQAGLTEEINKFVQIAALDSPNGPPPCGSDGVCNLAACPNDPDCPKNLPGNTNSSTSPEGTASVQHLLNKSVPTATSGKAPTNKTLTKAASENDAVYAVTIGEDSDDPCYMEIKYRDVATQGTQSSLKFSECAGHKVGDLLTASLPNGAFATGVRICLNSAGDKLKGIQLIGGYDDCVLGAESISGIPNSCSSVHNYSGIEYRVCDPDSPPYVTVSCSIPLTKFVERPNCRGSKHDEPDNDWEQVVSCPAKMVATGMKLRTIDGSGKRKMIDGVALVCDTLVPPN
jgi:hypothetical protein